MTIYTVKTNKQTNKATATNNTDAHQNQTCSLPVSWEEAKENLGLEIYEIRP